MIATGSQLLPLLENGSNGDDIGDQLLLHSQQWQFVVDAFAAAGFGCCQISLLLVEIFSFFNLQEGFFKKNFEMLVGANSPFSGIRNWFPTLVGTQSLIPLPQIRVIPMILIQLSPLFCEVNIINDFDSGFWFLNPESKYTVSWKRICSWNLIGRWFVLVSLQPWRFANVLL